MIENKIQEFTQELIEKNRDFINSIASICRKTDKGLVLKDENYDGISDRKGNFGYIRYMSDEDETIQNEDSDGRLTSAKTKISTSELRLVIITRCDDVSALKWKLINDIETSSFKTNVSSAYTDRNIILDAETDEKAKKINQDIKLIAIDFEFNYKFVPCSNIQIKCCDE